MEEEDKEEENTRVEGEEEVDWPHLVVKSPLPKESNACRKANLSLTSPWMTPWTCSLGTPQ